MRLLSTIFIGAVLVTSALPAGTAIAVPAQGDVRPLVSGERVRVNKITRDITSAMQELDKNGAKPFQDPAYVKRWQQSYERFKKALAKYPQVNDPDVIAATRKLQEYANLIQVGINEGTKQVQQTGDVQARLAKIETAFRSNQPPGWLKVPFTEEQVRQWINKAGVAKGTAESAIAALDDIAKNAYLPVNAGPSQSGDRYDKQDLSRLKNYANSIVKKVNEAVVTTEQNLRHAAEMQGRELQGYNQIDPNDPSDQANYFLNEGAEARMYAGFERQLAIANSFVAYQKGLGQQPNKAVTDRVAYIEGVKQRYGALREKLLGESSLPEAKSTDSKLIDIANRILAIPRYKFGNHGPVVLTSKGIVQKEKELSEEEYNDVDISLSGEITLTGTKTTWHYRWDEFTFATPIQDPHSKQWYVWWITAKKFSSGASTTPIGEWVSGGATKGGVILEKTFKFN
ncbi:hypothetical protein [Alteromonas lipolytica]|uniref:Uncharacterized protein n=1 Tax=Alteromonas lipolytica TaxID=1856405 RepID=A0A1E8FFQ1_9ALTE|nr:hypothetical protein [Alteromonas lipolytica]OFI34762.1 hypothetical protein BFC17_14375 [Alteromonas lipolytica]GGF53791.1 hypothetical protein GCM10011338_02430 [Alteromonas lipolytica]